VKAGSFLHNLASRKLSIREGLPKMLNPSPAAISLYVLRAVSEPPFSKEIHEKHHKILHR
jgi:hypothetical protein